MLDQLTASKTLRQAFEHVRDNAGCPGADGMSVHDFGADLETEIGRLQDRLLRRRYQPFPLLRFAVAKRGGDGVRHLCVPTVRDRVVQTAAHLVTDHLFEAEFEESSFAYRHGRSVRTAIHRVRELRDQGYLRLLGKSDFRQTPDDGVLLTHEALRRYFVAYEEELERPFAIDGQELTFRQLFRRQAERLARTLTAGEPYRSFRLPC